MKSKLQQLKDGDVALHFEGGNSVNDLNRVLKHCFPGNSKYSKGLFPFYFLLPDGFLAGNEDPRNKPYYPLSDFLAELEELEKHKLYTIEDFKAGKVQAKRDGASDEEVLRLGKWRYDFPLDEWYYFVFEVGNNRLIGSVIPFPNLPIQSVRDFLKQLPDQKQEEIWIPKWGEEVEVSADNGTWFKRKYVGLNPCDDLYSHVTVSREFGAGAFKNIRKPQPAPTKLTKAQIEEKLGYKIEIVE